MSTRESQYFICLVFLFLTISLCYYLDIQPDKGLVQAIESIRSNPKFKRLLNFQLNTLVGYLTPPNPKFHENGLYVIKCKLCLELYPSVMVSEKDRINSILMCFL